MNKKEVIHVHHGILLSHEKECNNAVCSNINGPKDNQGKCTKSERERQISYDITYRRNVKIDTNELNYRSETDAQTWKTNL